MDEDRRKLERKHLVHQLMVFDRDTGDLAGYLVDITTEGIMLMSRDPIEAGVTRKFRMLLPAKIRGSLEVAFDARSVWSRRTIPSGLYEIGFRLLGVSEEDMDTIRSLIDEFGTTSSQ